MSNAPTLGFTRGALRALTVLNILYAAAIAGLLVATFFIGDWLFTSLSVKEGPGRGTAITAMRWLVVVGIAGAAVVHLVLMRLRAIVETVRQGDPFIEVNADRLQTIAWSVLGLELLRLAAGALGTIIRKAGQPIDVYWNFSFNPWMAVLLLFVLAGVFRHGARMRADLEGTV